VLAPHCLDSFRYENLIDSDLAGVATTNGTITIGRPVLFILIRRVTRDRFRGSVIHVKRVNHCRIRLWIWNGSGWFLLNLIAKKQQKQKRQLIGRQLEDGRETIEKAEIKYYLFSRAYLYAGRASEIT